MKSQAGAFLWLAMGLLLTGLFLATGLVQRTRNEPPPPLDHKQVEPWMAEALPFVGPVTAATVAALIRQGNLPPQRRAATAARTWFIGLPPVDPIDK